MTPARAGRAGEFARRMANTKNVRRGRCPHRPGRMQSQNCTMFGEIAKRSVGADASVRPLGNGKFAAMYYKNERAACGSMWASTPTNIVRIRIGASVFVGTYRRAGQSSAPTASRRTRQKEKAAAAPQLFLMLYVFFSNRSPHLGQRMLMRPLPRGTRTVWLQRGQRK